MYRFFVSSEQFNTDGVVITGEDYHHIRNVLRMKAGEEILVCDGGEREYRCQITGYADGDSLVEAKIVDILGNARELPSRITLFQGYPKGDKMETIVQKAVELGAARIVPVEMKRCVVKLDAKKADKKLQRLNAVACSAAKQSKRGRIPEVTGVMSLEDACSLAQDLDYILLPYENADNINESKKVIENAMGKRNIGVFIGPEGGFEPSEVDMIRKIGGKTLTLGHRILRTETAGIAVLSLLMFLLEKDE
ncbi:MAG: 16S rRNA (uracil(1498)-N(3))-methyltransferase [Bacteroidales bacterium]|nr:16S rRNA (uracil(1498)-N(3))-methyltransferase [Clostridium sp.]MCM1202583.1 16S rRNA (uracil(1498)-N(3))-methyltransferase [Bacteroidales bacterium]